MSTFSAFLIEDAAAWLKREIEGVTDPSPLTLLLASWFSLGIFSPGSIKDAVLTSIAAAGPSRRHQDVAVIGFHLSRNPQDRYARVSFLSGLDWLIGRADFVAEGVPSGLLVDWPSLLGIQAGLLRVDDAAREKYNDWYIGICQKGAKMRGIDQFHRTVLSYAAACISSVGWSCDEESSDFQAALQRIGLFASDQIDWSAVWRLLPNVESCHGDPHRHIIRLCSIHAIRAIVGNSNVGVVTRSQLCELLKGVNNSFLRWPWELKPRTRRETAVAQRWDLQNEYHFQSLLWAVIKPHFLDLQEETYLPRTGQLQPRADLCLPSLKTVIEVKFWYSGDRVTRLIEEIAADHSLYLRDGSPYESLLVAIWDDKRRSEDHGELVRGLQGLRGILDVVVISRPARMDLLTNETEGP